MPSHNDDDTKSCHLVSLSFIKRSRLSYMRTLLPFWHMRLVTRNSVYILAYVREWMRAYVREWMRAYVRECVHEYMHDKRVSDREWSASYEQQSVLYDAIEIEVTQWNRLSVNRGPVRSRGNRLMCLRLIWSSISDHATRVLILHSDRCKHRLGLYSWIGVCPRRSTKIAMRRKDRCIIA